MARRTSRFEPDTLIGLMPMPESRRIFLPISLFRNSMTFWASGVPSRHSMPA